MVRAAIGCGLAWLLSAGVVAQDTEPGRRPEPGAPRLVDRPGFDRAGGPWPFYGRVVERMRADLELDDEQRVAFEELTAGFRQRMADAGARWEEMRAARESGDEARAAELRRDMDPSRGQEEIDAALDQLETHLRPEQIDKLDAMRDRMERDRAERDGFRRLVTDLPDRLELNDEQKAQYDEVMAENRRAMGERFSAMRPLWEELREARDNGDAEAAAALQAQLDAQRPRLETQMGEIFSRLEPLLSDAQKATMHEFRDEVLPASGEPESAAADAGDGKSLDAREVLRLARRVRLNDEQRESLREIEKEIMREYRGLRGDAEARRALGEQAREKIVALLDAAQAERFATLIERQSRRSARP